MGSLYEALYKVLRGCFYFHLWSHDLDFFTPPPSRPLGTKSLASTRIQQALVDFTRNTNLLWKTCSKLFSKMKKASGSQLFLVNFDKCYTLSTEENEFYFLTQKTQSKIFRFTQSYPIFNQNNTSLLWFSPLHL